MLNIHSACVVKFRREIINPDGSLAFRSPWQKNLTLDGGLDYIGTSKPWAQLTAFCARGTSSNPTKRDSAGVTFSRAANTVTASAGFFEAGDVGRLLKFDSGEEMYVTAYLSAVSVTVGTAGPLPASQGTIWYVNDFGHGAEVDRTNSYSAGNGTLIAGNQITFTRVFLFPAEIGTKTYRELGWAPAADGQLTGREVVSPGDTLITGQQYKVTVKLNVTVSPSVATAVADVGGGGYNTAGNIAIETFETEMGYALSIVNGAGNTAGQGALAADATSGGRVCIYLGDFVLTPLTAAAVLNPASAEKPPVFAGYTAGSFFRDLSATYNVGDAVGTHYGVALASATTARVLTLKYTTPQVKDNAHSLTVSFRLSWGRILTN